MTTLLQHIPFSLRVALMVHRLFERVKLFADVSTERDMTLEQEFISLITSENNTISKICFSYSTSAADYEDLRQEALINIWRGLKSFRGEAKARTWIYRVTINSCISAIKKVGRQKFENLDDYDGLFEVDDERKEIVEQIYGIIATLGIEERAIIMMWLDEMNYDEIASVMGMNRNTVATRLRRAKEKIVEQYKIENS